MRHYSVDHQNYYIFKSNTGSRTPFVHFQWGKFDFRMKFVASNENIKKNNSKITFTSANGKEYLANILEVFYQNEWFEFVKATSHGMQLEETLWTFNGKEYYVEFPKNFWSVAQSICSKELGMSSLEKT